MSTPHSEPRRFIDLQLSLQSVIAGAVAVGSFMVWMGYQASQQTSNTEQLKVGMAKLEKRFDDKDGRFEDMRDKMFEFKTMTDNLKMRVDALERAKK